MTFLALTQILNTETTTAELGKIVAFDQEKKYTRGEFLASVYALKIQLEQRAEKRWLLVHDNSYCFAIGFMALLAANKALVLPPNAQPGTLADLHDKADALLGDGTTSLPLLAIDPLINFSKKITSHDFESLDKNSLTITVMTSGSTGQAKSITKPLSCFEEEIQGLEKRWGQQLGQAVVMASVSHQHIYGLIFRVLWPLCAGRVFNANTHAYPEQLIADIKQHPHCVLVSSPAHLKRFPPGIDLSLAAPHIVAVFSSGGPLPLDAALDWQQRAGQTPIEVLGSTETGGIAWRQQTAASSTETATPWTLFNGVEIAIDKDSLLSVRSPFVVPEKNRPATEGYATGDRAARAEQGSFYLLGRADAIVKIEEKRLSLPAMEQHLQQNVLIAEARVVPLPDEQGRLGAVIVLSAAGHAQLDPRASDSKKRRSLSDRLRNDLLAHYERILLPRKWRFVESLPANSQGKTTLADLQKLFKPATDQRVVLLDFQNKHFFDGHFPGLPILPGVVQLDIALRECADWYPLDHFRGLEKLKFLEPIIPSDAVTLTLKKRDEGTVHFDYTLFNNTDKQRSLSSGRILFHTKERASHV